MPKAIMTCGWAPDDQDEWNRLDMTSRDVVHIERRFPGLTAQQLFNDVSFDNLYKAVWLTLRRREEIPKELSLDVFMNTHMITANEGSLPGAETDGGGDQDGGDPDGDDDTANPTIAGL